MSSLRMDWEDYGLGAHSARLPVALSDQRMSLYDDVYTLEILRSLSMWTNTAKSRMRMCGQKAKGVTKVFQWTPGGKVSKA